MVKRPYNKCYLSNERMGLYLVIKKTRFACETVMVLRMQLLRLNYYKTFCLSG